VVEDVAAHTMKNGRQWNSQFSPLEVGKRWFYSEIEKLARLETKPGYETKALRDAADLKKSSRKLAEVFSAHCVDSWVLANWFVGGHVRPDLTVIVVIEPLILHRRQLHKLQPAKGGGRTPSGEPRSLGFERGSMVKHPRWGVTYVGGTAKGRVTLHDRATGERLARNIKAESLVFLNDQRVRVRAAQA
jgi:hypothetical protein